MHETVKRTDQKQALHQLKCLMGAMVEEASLKKVFYKEEEKFRVIRIKVLGHN